MLEIGANTRPYYHGGFRAAQTEATGRSITSSFEDGDEALSRVVGACFAPAHVSRFKPEVVRTVIIERECRFGTVVDAGEIRSDERATHVGEYFCSFSVVKPKKIASFA
jgi:hypothetical protein